MARHRAAGRRQRRPRSAAQLPRRADARDRRGLRRSDWLRDSAEVRGRRGGGRDADRGGELGDARPLAAGLLAVDQPPDPERARPPAPDARHALRAHRARGAASPPALAIPQDLDLLRRHLRLRRAARADDRPRCRSCGCASREPDRAAPVPDAR